MLAIAECQLAKILIMPPSSRASSLPQVFLHPLPQVSGWWGFGRPHARRRLAVGVVLVDLRGLALFIEEHLANACAVPQPLTGFGVFRGVGDDAHAAALGEPIQGRARRVEPAVQAVEPFQQRRGKFILDAAAGDLPDAWATLAVRDQYFVNEGIMHVPGQHHVITGRTRVAENIQDHLGSTAMGHPVFRVHQQRITAPTEHPLHSLDQLHTEDRRR